MGSAIPSEKQQRPSRAATPEENYCLKNQTFLDIYLSGPKQLSNLTSFKVMEYDSSVARKLPFFKKWLCVRDSVTF